MSQPEKERRHAVLVVLYVLGTLLLFLLTQRREQPPQTLRFGETREGELRDALASAAAPDLSTEPGEGLEAAGFEEDALLSDLSGAPRSPWKAESEDGFRPLDSGLPREPDWLAGRCR